MQVPALPPDEHERLQALKALELLDTPAEERFDRFTRLAQHIFRVPIVAITLLDTQRQWLKSKIGLDVCETPRDISFCGHTILGENTLVVQDARTDPRFADNPLVSGDPHIRFYAGAPLRCKQGYKVGVLCIIDTIPHDFPPHQAEILRELADSVQQELHEADLRQTEKRLMRSQLLYGSVLDTVFDGIVTFDTEGIIQTANTPVSRIFGHDTDSLTGQPFSRLFPEQWPALQPRLSEQARQQVNDGVLWRDIELNTRHRDGHPVQVSLAISSLKFDGQRLFTATLRDITDIKSAEQHLYDINNQRQAILDSADFTIISTDIDGVIRTFNRGAQRMLGYDEDEVVDKMTPGPLHDPDEVIARAAELSAELGQNIEPGFEVFICKARSGQIDAQEWTYIRKDGSRFPVLLSVSALHDQNGNLTGFLGIGSDITERKKIDQIKNEFISTVSHELRTPLTSIRGALGLVLGKASDGLSDKARTLLETANRNCERLTLLINDILDLEKIESGKLNFTFLPVDLVQIARQATSANEGYASRHQISLVLHEELATAPISGDEHRLMQVFANLISNAVKYSPPEGEVSITVRRHRSNVRVEVSDHGRGIPEEFRTRIFGRFAQLDSTDSREKGGTGLGLSITRAILQRHAGSIDYISTPGQGTTFYFEIPLRDTGNSNSQADILICEDDTDAARILQSMLEKDGFSCDITHTASDTRAALEQKKYSVLLLDLGLPDKDGLELLHDLNEENRVGDMPIIIVSGRHRSSGEQSPDTWKSLVDWLEKPVDMHQLSQAIKAARTLRERPSILHVEDDPDIVAVTRSLLEDDPVDYVSASTLAEARACLGSSHFDVLLLDLGLPDGNGMELLEALSPQCQVVILSGQQIGPLLRAEQIAAVLTKAQMSNDTLLDTLKQVIHQDKERR